MVKSNKGELLGILEQVVRSQGNLNGSWHEQWAEQLPCVSGNLAVRDQLLISLIIKGQNKAHVLSLCSLKLYTWTMTTFK